MNKPVIEISYGILNTNNAYLTVGNTHACKFSNISFVNLRRIRSHNYVVIRGRGIWLLNINSRIATLYVNKELEV